MTRERIRTGETLHLTPRDVWERQASEHDYRPEAYEAVGFIHCTDGDANLLRVANHFYAGDDREQVVLVLDVGRVEADVAYEDAERIFPHIYGPLNTDAVVGLRSIERSPDGTFTRVGDQIGIDRS